MSTAERVLSVLADVTEVSEVRDNLDVHLYDSYILDSLKTVELIIALSDNLGVEISPAELDREEWSTPAKIVSYVETRLQRPT
jgi:D-alanine--poly(phosphoribitol) ligase subunit 2